MDNEKLQQYQEQSWTSWRTSHSLEISPPILDIVLKKFHLTIKTNLDMLAAAVQDDRSGPQGDARCDVFGAEDSLDQPALELDQRAFEDAVTLATDYVQGCEAPTAELLAARASALFRVRRTDDAAAEYHRVLQLDALHAEAHLRLGSGLSAPRVVTIGEEVRQAVACMGSGDLMGAIEQLQELLASDPGNPVLHRLLGEALFQQRANASMAGEDPVFARLRQQRPMLPIDKNLLAEFIPAYAELSPARQAAAHRREA